MNEGKTDPAVGPRRSVPFAARVPAVAGVAEAGERSRADRASPRTANARAEQRLVRRVFARCDAILREVCAYSSVPPEFLGALTASESGGDPKAARFEPAVYRHLKAVAEGMAPAYAGLGRESLDAEIEDMLHPKASEFHARYLTQPFRANHQREIAACDDEALRELATSWGYTQVMGYHMVGRHGTVRDLLEPRFHFRLALELLAQFAERYQLDLAREFEEMFRCWNTGQPYGATFDPAYVENGVRRMSLYREIAGTGFKD